MTEVIYEVFARAAHDQALRHVGSVNAADEELARVFAWSTYDEESWVEMCVVPRSAILPVTRHGKLPLWGN